MRVKLKCLTLVLASAGLWSGWAQAAPASDTRELAELRAQLQALKAAYETLERRLDARLAQAEARADSSAQAAAELQAAVPVMVAREVAPLTQAPAVTSRRTAANSFNPDISLIIDSKFARTTRLSEGYAVRGFLPNGGEIGPPARSFSLGESELAMSASIDHYFRGNARFSLADEGGQGVVAVEEANIETLALPAGMKLKAGRYLSGIGYLNAQHPHEWDFVDAPLVYKALFGYRLQNDGVQLRWVAPTPFWLEFGGELARGGTYPGAERNKNGSGLGAVFVHTGGDIGNSLAWQAGVSYVTTQPRERSVEAQDGHDLATLNTFSGRSHTWVADAVLKWAPDGNPQERHFKLQGEYLQRSERGELACSERDGSGAACGSGISDSYRARPSGWYAQAVYQFMPRWRVGLRLDRLSPGLVDAGSLTAAELGWLDNGYRPRRQSAMIDFSPSEFSRIRLQLARDQSRGDGQGDNQLFLQYIMSLGAHGAHKF